MDRKTVGEVAVGGCVQRDRIAFGETGGDLGEVVIDDAHLYGGADQLAIEDAEDISRRILGVEGPPRNAEHMLVLGGGDGDGDGCVGLQDSVVVVDGDGALADVAGEVVVDDGGGCLLYTSDAADE